VGSRPLDRYTDWRDECDKLKCRVFAVCVHQIVDQSIIVIWRGTVKQLQPTEHTVQHNSDCSTSIA